MLPYNPKHSQWSLEDVDESYRQAIEVDRREEYYRRLKEHKEKQKRQEKYPYYTPKDSAPVRTVTEYYWEILAPHFWKFRQEPTLQCQLSCPACDEILYTIEGSALSEDNMWLSARKGVRAMRAHKCKAIPKGEDDEASV